MAISPRAFALDHYQDIVNVGWPSSFNVDIEASSSYNEGPPLSRTANVALTPAGVAAGGVILSQTLNDTISAMTFSASIQFKRILKGLDTGAALFAVNFSGAFMKGTPSAPPLLQEPFCGTTTVTVTTSAISARRNPYVPETLFGIPVPTAWILSQEFSITKSGPGGGSSNTHSIDLAGNA